MNVEMLNKTTKNLNTVLKSAEAIQALCRDHKVNTKDMTVGDDLRLKLGSRRPMQMNQLAQGQLCGKLHVPGKYVIRLHLRLIEKEKMEIDGEDLFAGLTVDSSDVGRSSLKVKFFIWKQVCTNGLIIPTTKAELFTQKHVGITSEEFGKSLSAGLEQVDDLKRKIGEWIEEARTIPTDTDMEALTETIREKTGLSEDDSNEVISFMVANYSPTKWGLINGLTEIAQKFEFERQAELEEIAGNWLFT